MKNDKQLLPKVSIVIPVYNGSNYLREAIDSALAQTYKNIEIIVVNDGSKDNGATEEIAKSYGDRIVYYKKDNGGVATALNLGIKKMTGEYFSWLSHDDLYAQRKIELQIAQLMKEGSEKIVIACNTKTLFKSGVKKRTKIDPHTFKYLDVFLSCSAMTGLHGCSLLIPRSAFNEVGIFDSSLLYTQDYDLWFRMQKKFRFVLLNDYLVISRAHSEQGSVRDKKQMAQAVDELHYKLITKIPYVRFDQYFKLRKQNIKYVYENYKLYKKRKYKRTASILLKILLRFCYENSKAEFYRIYDAELGLNNVNLHENDSVIKKNFNDADQVYATLINSETELLPIRYSISTQPLKYTRSRMVLDSLRNDGIYLSSEKAIRRLLLRLLKKNN